MRIDCLHGYYKFQETSAGELSEFANLFGLELERSGDHFTFSDLVDAPTYSLTGGTFLGCPTIFPMEGPPWEVMRKNKLVYDFQKGLVVPTLAIVVAASVDQAGFSFVSNGMLLAGSLTSDGTRITDYSAFYNQSKFRYSEVEFDFL